MAIEDSLQDLVSGNWFGGNTTASNEAESYLYLILTLVGIGIVAFIGARYILKLSQRPDGKYAGECKFQIANFNNAGANEITAHLSLARDQFTPRMSSDLMRITMAEKQINPESTEEFNKLIGKCFIFNGNVSDFKKDNILKGNKKAIFLCNVDVSQEKYYREEAEGHFDITTASFHKWTRNIQCISGKSISMGNKRGEEVDVYLINVHGNDLTEVHNQVMSEAKFQLETYVFPDNLSVEILGKLAMFLPTLVELYNKVEPSDEEINRLRDKVHEMTQKEGELHAENEIAKDRAVRKRILGHEHPFVQPLNGVAWGWQLITGVMGMLGYYMADTEMFFRNIPIISNPIVFGFILIVIAVVIRYTFENRQPAHKQSKETSESEGKGVSS
jgi:hypothetical protein